MQLEEEADEARQAKIRERRWKRAEELLAAKGLMQKMARISKKRAHPSVSEVKIEPEDFI